MQSLRYHEYMWQDITLALCLIGFIAALALTLVELPAVVRQARRVAGRHR